MKAQFKSGIPNVIDYTPGSAVSVGDVVVIGTILGIAHQDIASGALGSLAIDGGIYDVVKITGSISQWTLVYWNATGDPVGGTAGTGAATTTAGSNNLLGIAIAAAGSSDTTVRILKLTPTTVYSPMANAITDPGTGGAIPVTSSGYCPIVTAGSETRTLAAPSFIGQQLLLYIKTDGGTCVITVASAINQTGNNTITMADVRDVIQLVAIESGSNKVWHVVSNDGAALSTV
jgi:predicted RecA/RadA family phage recombinase